MRAIQQALFGVVEHAERQSCHDTGISHIRNRDDQLPHGLHQLGQRIEHPIWLTKMLQHITRQYGVKTPPFQPLNPVIGLQIRCNDLHPQGLETLECTGIVLDDSHPITPINHHPGHGSRTRAQLKHSALRWQTAQQTGSPVIPFRIESIVVSFNIAQVRPPEKTSAIGDPIHPTATTPMDAPGHRGAAAESPHPLHFSDGLAKALPPPKTDLVPANK